MFLLIKNQEECMWDLLIAYEEEWINILILIINSLVVKKQVYYYLWLNKKVEQHLH